MRMRLARIAESSNPRKFLLGIAAVLVLAGAVGVALRSRHAQWSTTNPEALRMFEEGLAASMKYYRNDARRFFAKAAEADPSFWVAKAFLLGHLDPRADPEGVAALKVELASADLTPLTRRERFLIQRSLANAERDVPRASALTQAFTADYPNDSFGLAYRGQDAVLEGNLDEAKQAFQRLVELDPNWVMAYNHLGYIAMAEGKLDEAERMFTLYRYIAPDQANPHDSLGELYLLTGRFEEAEQEFELAIQARLDFQPSYENLIRLEALRGSDDGVEAALFRARESGAVPDQAFSRLQCWARGWLAAREGDWKAVADLAEQACAGDLPFDLALRAALFTGRRQLEAATMQRFAAYREKLGGAVVVRREEAETLAAYLEGIRAAYAGELERAAEQFRAAATAATLWGVSRGFAKLSVWSAEAQALQILGRSSEAAAVEAAMRAINPRAQEILAKATDLPLPPPAS